MARQFDRDKNFRGDDKQSLDPSEEFEKLISRLRAEAEAQMPQKKLNGQPHPQGYYPGEMPRHVHEEMMQGPLGPDMRATLDASEKLSGLTVRSGPATKIESDPQATKRALELLQAASKRLKIAEQGGRDDGSGTRYVKIDGRQVAMPKSNEQLAAEQDLIDAMTRMAEVNPRDPGIMQIASTLAKLKRWKSPAAATPAEPPKSLLLAPGLLKTGNSGMFGSIMDDILAKQAKAAAAAAAGEVAEPRRPGWRLNDNEEEELAALLAKEALRMQPAGSGPGSGKAGPPIKYTGMFASIMNKIAEQYGPASVRHGKEEVEETPMEPAAVEVQEPAAPVAPQAPTRGRKRLIVDGASTEQQLSRAAFLRSLRAEVTAAADAALGPVQSVVGCPYIEAWFAKHADSDAWTVEAMAKKYSGLKSADNATDYIAPIIARLQRGIARWQAGQDISSELNAAGMGGGAGAVVQSAAAGGAEPGSVMALEEQLGAGASMDSAAATRIGAGSDASDVRVHEGPAAAAQAAARNAVAFAVGNNIVMGANAPKPGTSLGDALLAHEYAHTKQQRDANQDPAARRQAIGDEQAGPEVNADEAVVAALTGLGAKWHDVMKTGLQLQRCVGVANAPGLDHVFKRTFQWSGDEFQITLKQDTTPLQGHATFLRVEIKYVGDEDTDGHDASFTLSATADRAIRPKLTFDKSDGWSLMEVDLYGDGDWKGSVTHQTTMLPGWNPNSRLHRWVGTGKHDSSGDRNEVVVKSKNAIPDHGGASANQDAIVPAQLGMRTDFAVLSAEEVLKTCLNDKTLGIDVSQPAWAALKAKIDADVAKFATSPNNDAEASQRSVRVATALRHIAPMLRALHLANNKDAFLPDIADRAIAIAAAVRKQFDDGLQSMWTSYPNAQLTKAETAFEAMWYRISSLYLEQGAGADKMIADAGWAAQEVGDLRGQAHRGAVYYPQVEAMIGVPAARHRPGDRNVVTNAKANWLRTREAFMAGNAGVMKQILHVVQDAQLAMGLAAILSTNEIMYLMRQEMTGITGAVTDTLGRDLKAVCSGYIKQLEGLAASVEGGVKTTGSIETAGRPAIARFQALVGTKAFKDDMDAIKSRIKTIGYINMLAKVLAIVGVAALTGGAAGAAAGGMLEGAGASAAMVSAGSFGAEVVAFTLMSRLGNDVAFGKNETGLGEDLITNALMMGTLKAAAAAYGKVFKVVSSPTLIKSVGGAATGFVALQAFAEAHYAVKHDGKLMDGDARLQGLLSNGVMMAALALGGHLAKPLNARIRADMLLFTARNVPGRLEAIEAKIGAIKGEMGAIRGPDQAAALLKKIEVLWNQELGVLAEAAKLEKAEPAKAAEAFKATVASYTRELAKLELQLAQTGLDVALGVSHTGNLFRPKSPGYVVFRPDGMEVLREYYAQQGGTFTQIKEGLYSGKRGGEQVMYVTEALEPTVFAEQRARIPSEAEAKANRDKAQRARVQNEVRAEKVKAQVAARSVDGHVMHHFKRLIAGNGMAAALDANTLAGPKGGSGAALPEVMGIGTGKETYSKLGETPIGQDVNELNNSSWGMQPSEFTADHGHYTTATVIADATAYTQFRSGTPILDAALMEVSVTRDATWKVEGAKVRLKVQIAGVGERYLYGDATDLATGLGAPGEMGLSQIAGDVATAKTYKATMEADGRMIYGDVAGNQRGGRVLVVGGSATGAWNAKLAAKLGGKVDWIARAAREPSAPPKMEPAKLKYAEIQEMANRGELSPEQAAKELAQVRAFDSALLPRNAQSAAESPFQDPNVTLHVKDVVSITPTETITGEAPGKALVAFSDGSKAVYDQVVTSISTNPGQGPVPGSSGALGLAKGIEMRPVFVDGQLVALESVEPPGAVRVVGAPIWNREWAKTFERGNPELKEFMRAVDGNPTSATRDSPAGPLMHNTAKQIEAANQARSSDQ